MRRDYRLYLDDILESINNIRDYTKGMDYNAFLGDRKTRDAVPPSSPQWEEGASEKEQYFKHNPKKILLEGQF